MAGNLKTNSVQLGDSATATQNFVLQTNVDGTAKLARGNLGATTQDILTVDAAGKAAFPQGLADFVGANQLLAASGYQKLPGGLIIQWGAASPITTGVAVTYPIPFTSQVFQVVISQRDAATAIMGKATTASLTGFTAYASVNGYGASWIAIGI